MVVSLECLVVIQWVRVRVARENHANSLANFPPTQQQIGFYRGKTHSDVQYTSIEEKSNTKLKGEFFTYVFISKFRWIKLVIVPHFTCSHVHRALSQWSVLAALGGDIHLIIKLNYENWKSCEMENIVCAPGRGVCRKVVVE